MKISSIKGFADMFAPDSEVFTYMENTARNLFEKYNFKELRTPILENTELFVRGIGTETDVVQKEMYTFTDKGERSVTMRPEATAGVMRAYLESGKYKTETVSKFYSFGPMFRYERPQKGRLRQFHQINCECLGVSEPYVDAQLITMATRLFEHLNIKDLTLHINSLGCPNCRPSYKEKLTAYLNSLDKSELCEDCNRRIDTNPLRVLDCKVATCKSLLVDAPAMVDNLCPECDEHFTVVKNMLELENIEYVLNPRLVRGLDYYTRTSFEIISDAIGAQGTVAGGGRYDGLAKQIGGIDLPAIGFACGMERLALLLGETSSSQNDFYIAPLHEDAFGMAFKLCEYLRDAGLSGDMGFSKKSMKATMRAADKSGAKYVLLIGEDELKANNVSLKNLTTGEQELVNIENILIAMNKG